jgi:formylglycine-generating enzyme required for sulfatase activity
MDVSVYGVRDLAGGVREWCRGADFDGDPTRRPVRGGCWSGAEKLTHAANRFGYEAWVAHGYIGLRLVLDLEPG